MGDRDGDDELEHGCAPKKHRKQRVRNRHTKETLPVEPVAAAEDRYGFPPEPTSFAGTPEEVWQTARVAYFLALKQLELGNVRTAFYLLGHPVNMILPNAQDPTFNPAENK
jgi:hypothetical protein